MKKLKKLKLNKETVAHLNQQSMSELKGGDDFLGITKGKCDFHTIGHDDGPYCLSKTDWGWCWCYGI